MEGLPGGGSKSIYNFGNKSEKERFEDVEGVPLSDLSLVAHEMEHQYDKEKGNQSDATDSNNADDPSEQRAVKTENEARKLEGLPLRTTYGGRKVPTNPQNYIMPTPQPKENKIKKK
ncbi:M91 family zinc metallopeptidase [Chryseobacterium formosense]|uniref:M91 family zinc metallopeptidase n=1 Tax=Chryseobacterium formosense TaxID=236814 RepID=UPI0009438B69|nr:M91 family zinc metallopeptidase [Chryseobacterium formosense]